MAVIVLDGLHAALVSALGAIFQGVTFPCNAAAPPLLTVYSNSAGQVGVSWSQSPTGGQDSTASSTIAAYDLSGTGQSTDLTAVQRSQASTLVGSDPSQFGKSYRGVASVLVDEINIPRRQVVGIATSTINPPSLANGTGVTSSGVTVTGAAFGDFVSVAAPYDLQGILATAYVSAADTVKVRLHNGTGGAIDLASGTWTVVVWRPEVMAPRTLSQAKTAVQNAINAGGQVD